MSQEVDYTIGMPKSGKPWRKQSTKSSSRTKQHNKLTWEDKQKVRQQKKELREYMDSLKDEKEKIVQKYLNFKKRSEIQRIKDKRKRDELNKYKTASLEIIGDSKKVKKWSKKARSTLVKLPGEIFEQLLAKKKGKNQ